MTSLLAIEGVGGPRIDPAAPPVAPAPIVRPGFEAALDAVRPVAEPSIGERFEASALTQFVAAMLPSDDAEVWGGSAGAMWKGLYAERLAESFAQSGGIGIAKMVDTMVERTKELP